MIESLETRSHLSVSPSAVLGIDGTLVVTGTKNYDRIAVDLKISIGTRDGAAGSAVTSAKVTDYVIKDKDKVLGTFNASNVKKIVINALGGSDRVTGAGLSGYQSVSIVDSTTYNDGGPATGTGQVKSKSSVSVAVPTTGTYTVATAGTTLNFAKLRTLLDSQIAPTEINGGAGNDRITGGIGNDTINGGTGNDSLVDNYGNNEINGNAGNDTINVLDGHHLLTNGGYSTVGSLTQGGSPDTVTGGAGTDHVFSNSDDVLTDTIEKQAFVYSTKHGTTTIKFNA